MFHFVLDETIPILMFIFITLIRFLLILCFNNTHKFLILK